MNRKKITAAIIACLVASGSIGVFPQSVPASMPTVKAAETDEKSGIEFITADNSDGTKTITGYTTSGSLPEEIVIPSEIDGAKVTALSYYLFQGKTEIKSVVIPGTIKEIPFDCFQGCTGLEKVTLSEGTESIEQMAFYGASSLKEIDLPDTVTDIGSDAFYGTAIENIVIPDTVTKIGAGAFSDTPYGEANPFIIRDGVLLSYSASNYGTSDENDIEVVVPESVTEIAPSAFFNRTSIASVILPEGLTKIGNDAFEYCTN